MKKTVVFIFLSIAVLLVSLRMDYFSDRLQGESLAVLAQFLSIVGDGITLTGVCVFLLVFGIVFKKGHIRNSGAYGISVIIAASFFVHLFKITFERPRPDFGNTDILFFLKNPFIFDFSGKFNSFPSGHTTVSFALAYALSRSYPRLSPLFYAIAAMVGFSRIYLGSHYPSDVAGAALLGLGVSMFLFSETRKKHWQTWLFISLAIFISFFKLGSLLLFDVDEAVFSEATREMVGTGDYITPTYNYEPRYDKPILFYWLMSLAFKLFGITEFSARFTSAMFGTALATATFFFVKKLYGQRPAILAGLCLLLNLEFFVYSHSAVTDMTLAFFITAALYSFYLGYQMSSESGVLSSELNNKWYLLFWVFAGLAALTKGVIGILFPAAIIFIYLAASRELSKVKLLLAPRFLLIFSAIAFHWYIAQFYINGWEFFNAFIIKHHFQRYTEVISSHSGPIYFYVPVILAGFFPWAAFLPNAIYRGFKGKGIYLFGAIWFLAIFIFFSISRTKLPNYIMPLFPAMAIITGLAINDFLENGLKKIWLYISCIFLMVVSLALAIASLFALTQAKLEIAFPPVFFWGTGISFLAIALFGFAMINEKHRLVSIGGMAAATIALLIFVRTYGGPPVNLYLQKTLYQYSVYAGKNLLEDGALATYNINQPSIVFYSRRKIFKLDGESGLRELAAMKNSKSLIVITRKENIQELEEKFSLTLLNTDGKYAMLANTR
ncbi:MAG: glycosyltransferase family 39 protein [Deltaproteobacteria bacterium]|nr:glycosyltransferase family 39 protein [Deltaproteobacteria bacterium]